MRRLFLSLCVSVLTLTLAHAGNDTPIQVSQLPQKAQTFISTHFSNLKVALATVESEVFSKTYDVMFTTGEKLEFDKSGQWTEVKTKPAAVPSEIVPEAIQTWVSSHYADAHIVKVERESKTYEVELSNRVEVKFNSKFHVIDIDMD